jgi:hypothetical protein
MKRFQIHLHPNQRARLNKVLLFLSILIVLLIKEIVDDFYFLYDIDAWDTALDLYRFAFLLLFFAIRKEVKSLIGVTFFVIIKWILINNFFDRYFGITDWSWNDLLTVLFALIELIYKKVERHYGKN